MQRGRTRSAGENRHGPQGHAAAGSHHVPHSQRRNIIAPETNGASTPPTISRMASPIHWKASRTASARWNSKTAAPLYDWFCENLGIHHPQQIEFNRLNLTHTMMSKRRLLQLVNDGHVNGWDDPRMPTISAPAPSRLHARIHPESVYPLWVSQNTTRYPIWRCWENQIREELNRTAERRMAVLAPLKVIITNYPEGNTEELDAVNNPEDAAARFSQGALRPRTLHRTRRLYGRPPTEILPPGPRARSPTSLGVFHQVQ